jgi:hypothetical protein
MSKILPVILAVVITLILIPLIGSVVTEQTACIPVTTEAIPNTYTLTEAEGDALDFLAWWGYWAGSGTIFEFRFTDDNGESVWSGEWVQYVDGYIDFNSTETGPILRLSYTGDMVINFDPDGLYEFHGSGEVVITALSVPH